MIERSRSPSPKPSLSSRISDYKTSNPISRWFKRNSIRLAVLLCMVLSLTALFYIAIIAHDRWLHSPTLGAVATENKICSQLGTDLLKAGGNAADALVGAIFCVGVIGMYHSGIGGGGFALVRGPDGRVESVDFRETAPAAARENMFQGNVNGSIEGGLASGVPGELRGLEYIHNRYGKLSWPTVMIPAIRLAREGFTITSDLDRYMQASQARDPFLTEDSSWSIDFAPNGTLKGLGDTLTRDRYAETLQTIASNGADAFYRGILAEATVSAIAARNGTMTLEDMTNYKVIIRPAASVDYRNYILYGCPAPASGAVAISALKTVEGYTDMGRPSRWNTSIHRLDEALRYAYAERSSLGDPELLPATLGLEKTMLSSSSAACRKAGISDTRTFPPEHYNPDGYALPSSHGTSHLVAADSSGLAISMTSTINLIFGSKLMVPGTGVPMNNQMNDFSLPGVTNEFGYPPAPANYIRPGKRPMSSMAPVLVEHRANGTMYAALGAAGGSRIVSAVVQNLWHVLDRGLPVARALGEARFHDQLIPDTVGFEWSSGHNDSDSDSDSSSVSGAWLPWGDELPLTAGVHAQRAESGIGTGFARGFDNATAAFMSALGHNVTWVPPGYSSAQALRLLWNGTWEAAGEPRQADSGGVVV